MRVGRHIDSTFGLVIFLHLLLNFSCNGQQSGAIILVNVGDASRSQIADLVSYVDKCRPQVIAIDLQFSAELDPLMDKKLQNALRTEAKLVMVSVIKDYSPSKPFQTQLIPGCLPKFTKYANTGFANLMVNDEHFSSLTRFSMSEFVNGTTERSFAFETAYQYDSLKASEFALHNSNYVCIDYSKGSDFFPRVSFEDVVSGKVDRREFKDKIVLLGFLGPGEEDKFSAPVGGRGQNGLNLYGLEIHAMIIAQILNE